MNKIKEHIFSHLKTYIIFICVLAVSLGIVIPITASQKSADYYENAKTFYNECPDKDFHTEYANQAIYYATRAKSASSINRRRYGTIGWQITAEANGYSMSIDVKRNGKYLKSFPEVKDEKYTYVLYCISYEDIAYLMAEKNPETWSNINKSSSVIFYMDAIMSIKNKGETETVGKITAENDDGTVEKDGTHIYYMRDTEQRSDMQKLFPSSNLTSYHGLKKRLDNPLLVVQYNIGAENVEIKNTTYTSDSNGNILKASTSKLVRDGAYRFGNITLRDAYESDYNLYKKGYHLVPEKEWEKVENPGSYWASAKNYFASTFEPKIAEEDATVTLKANWAANKYTIHYDANGGPDNVAIHDTNLIYDKTETLASATFVRDGYIQVGWNTKEDGTGISYALGEEVINLTDINGEVITLYANWEPVQIIITTNKHGGTGGTDRWYQWYDVGNFSDAGYVNPITSISLPDLTGYSFKGYYTSTNGNGTEVVKADGAITNAYFFEDTMVHAWWEPETYEIKLDNQGADIIGGTAAYYEKYDIGNYRDRNCTEAIAGITVPQKTGHTFGGYYTEKNGNGSAWISTNGKITSEANTFTADTTLYAYWIPNVYEITLDMQGGAGGTTHFFEKYGVGFYSDRDCTNKISTITIPTSIGNTFGGYWTMPKGTGEEIVSYGGTGTTTPIGQENTYFKSNVVLYASWGAAEYTITFDKQGGTGGTTTATVHYGDTYPMAGAPKRGAYTFMGYYTQEKGNGTLVYDMYMNSSQKYTLTTNQTLYAYWVDETAPTINLLTDYKTWTNKDITLTANASDYGSGLSSVHIYLLNDDGSISASPVASATNLNGVPSTQLEFVNKLEGVIRYKAIATDMEGHTSESVNVVYYDITPPSGTLISGGKDGDVFEFEFDITDINPGN